MKQINKETFLLILQDQNNKLHTMSLISLTVFYSSKKAPLSIFETNPLYAPFSPISHPFRYKGPCSICNTWNQKQETISRFPVVAVVCVEINSCFWYNTRTLWHFPFAVSRTFVCIRYATFHLCHINHGP